jgi:hypothetical protein
MLNIDEGFVLYTLPFGKCEIIITKIVLKYRKELYSFLKISTITVRIFSESAHMINNTPNFQKINPKYFCRLFKEI